MLSIEKFADLNQIAVRTVYDQIRKGKLQSLKLDGTSYVVTNEELELNDEKLKRQILKAKRKEWNRIILQLNQNIKAGLDGCNVKMTIDAIRKDVKHWEEKGIKVTGFSEKSLYRKIKQGKTDRKTRDDKHIYRNSVLKSVSALDKLLALASHFYFKNAYPNVNLTIDLIHKHAKENEDYWELADVPRSTMKRTLNKEFYSRGWKEKHQFLNHYNRWKQNKAKVHGAFTDHVKFMDWIVGDDHKSDIDKVLVFNPNRNEFEKQTVHGWFWLEAKTQKVLSYIIKPGELNAEDLILTLMDALMQYGKPNKGVLIDNGIGESVRFQEFLLKAGIPLKFSKPYEPTHKATIERSFAYHKTEHDAFLKNFVGSNHLVEGRHSTSKLSAEDCHITFNDYKKSLDTYLTNFYEQRERDRTIDAKVIRISIKELFDSFWKNFDKRPVDTKVLRYAYSQDEIRRFNNGISFIRNKTRFNYLPSEALAPAFNNRKYTVCFNPADLNVIDIYALEDIIDKTTGEFKQKGDYVTTLYNLRNVDPVERQAQVAKFNKQAEKYLRQYVKTSIDGQVFQQGASDSVNSTVNEAGKIISVRKRIEKDALSIIKNAVPVEKIKSLVSKQDKLPEEEAVLTEDSWKELEEIGRS